MNVQNMLLARLAGSSSSAGAEGIQQILMGDPMEGQEGSVKLPGARGAAARQAFRTEVRQRPLDVARTVWTNMATVLGVDPTAGSPAGSRGASMRAYFTQETPFSNYKTLTYVSFAVATALDWLASGAQDSVDHVKCLLSLLCVALDQVAIDGGAWLLGSLFLNLPEPPWALLGNRAPDVNTPFSKLADPRWTAALMGYLKDVDVLRTTRKGFQRPKAPGPTDGPPRGGGGAGERGRGRGRSRSGGKGNEAADGEG